MINCQNNKDLADSIINKIDFDNIKKHPNILIAARFWDDDRYNAATTCYKFMRTIDDMIDDRKAFGDALSCFEKELFTEKVNNWINCLDQLSNDNPFLMVVADIVNKFKIPLNFFYGFAKSMFHDIDKDGFSTLEEFMEYSRGASLGPASVFVHLCCLKEENSEYIAPEYNIEDLAWPCAIFSYIVHIIRDFEVDQRNNLNYFAHDILEKHGINHLELREMALKRRLISKGFRNVVKEYLEIAKVYRHKTIEAIEKLAPDLSYPYLMSLKVVFSLYDQIYDRIDVENGCFSTAELNPTPLEIKERVICLIKQTTTS